MSASEIAATYSSDIIVRRWFACWLDIGVYFLLAGVAGAVLGGRDDLELLLALSAAVLIYHTALEGPFGISVGKWVCGIRVVGGSGLAPGIGRASIRTVLRLIEVNPLLFGGLPAGLIADRSKFKQRFGDLLAGTYVVKLRDLRKSYPNSLPARIPGPFGDILESRGRRRSSAA